MRQKMRGEEPETKVIDAVGSGSETEGANTASSLSYQDFFRLNVSEPEEKHKGQKKPKATLKSARKVKDPVIMTMVGGGVDDLSSESRRELFKDESKQLIKPNGKDTEDQPALNLLKVLKERKQQSLKESEEGKRNFEDDKRERELLKMKNCFFIPLNDPEDKPKDFESGQLKIKKSIEKIKSKSLESIDVSQQRSNVDRPLYKTIYTERYNKQEEVEFGAANNPIYRTSESKHLKSAERQVEFQDDQPIIDTSPKKSSKSKRKRKRELSDIEEEPMKFAADDDKLQFIEETEPQDYNYVFNAIILSFVKKRTVNFNL